MKKIHFIALISSFLFAGLSYSADSVNIETGNYPIFSSQKEQLLHKNSMDMFENARLGMFIHWLPWAPMNGWGMYYNNIPLDQYKKLVRSCKGEQFDAKAIVDLAKKAGMKYITFVAKHHDGFCLWDSKYSDFTSVKYPMRRDIVGEMSKACEAAGMPLIIYYSLGLDWGHPDFITRAQYINARPNTPDANKSAQNWKQKNFERYRKFCKDQLAELNRKYKISGFWFDPLGGVLANPELFDMDDFYHHIRTINPSLLILNKTGITGTEDVVVGERELASIAMHYGTGDENSRKIRQLADIAWKKNRFKKAEIAVTAQGNWCWGSEQDRCLPADRLYGMLKKAADNNANLLLNFGPRKNGSIPDDVVREFTALGKMIQEKGYPELNKLTWKEKRLGKGEVLDGRESLKTAR